MFRAKKRTRLGSSAASKTSKARRRNSLTNATRPITERLEERRLLSTLDPQVTMGLAEFPTDITNTLTSAESNFTTLLDHPLPIIGSALGNQFNSWSNSLGSLASKLGNVFTQTFTTTTEIGTALANALGPSGAGLLQVSNGNLPAADETDNSSTDATRVEFMLPLTQTAEVLSNSIPFSAGLPGFNFSTQEKATLTVKYTLQLNFGYDLNLNGTSQAGFFLDTSPTPPKLQTASGISLTATMNLSNNAPVSGNLFNLSLMASDHSPGDGADGNDPATGMPYTMAKDPYGHTNFIATFNTTFTDSNAGDNNNLPIPGGLGNLGLNMNLSGDAQINLDLNASFGADADFPSLQTMFHLDWPFNDAPVSIDTNGSVAGFGSPPTIVFENVSLDMGSFFNNLVYPIAEHIDQIFNWGPIADVFNFFNDPIPIINDFPAAAAVVSSLYNLGSGPITFLEVAQAIDPSSTILKFFKDADIIKNLASELTPTTISGSPMISLGSFTLGGPGGTNLTNVTGSDLRLATADDFNNLDLTDLSDSADPNSIQQQYSSFANPVDDAAGNDDVGDFLTQLFNVDAAGPFAGSTAESGDNGSLLFPILTNPETAFNLLLGQTVNLMTFTMPTFTVTGSYNPNPWQLGPIGVHLHGNLNGTNNFIEATANLSGGYDTQGLTDYISSGKSSFTKFLDGFYINTANTSIGASVGLEADAYFGLEQSVVDFAEGVFGGINGSFNLSLNPPAGSGSKLRFQDIFGPDGNDGELADGTLFNFSGEIDASFGAFVQIGVETPFGFLGYENHWTIANTTLISFGQPVTSTVSTDVAVTDSGGETVKEYQYVSFTADVTSASGGSIPLGTVDFNITETNSSGVVIQSFAPITEQLVDGTATSTPVQFATFGVANCSVSYTPSANTEYQPSTGALNENSFSRTNVVGTIYVNESATGNGNGLSFANGLPTITEALADAAAGDTIAVAQGVYQQNTIMLPYDVTIVGGFPEDDTGAQPANPYLYATYLEAEDDNEPAVAATEADDSSTILDGFTITGGSGANGGGITISGGGSEFPGLGTPVIEDCIFEDNASSIGGGAVYCTQDASPKFVQCVFYDNGSASNQYNITPAGGAIYNSEGSDPSFVNCTFAGNATSGNGGAIYNLGDLSLTNCIVWGDTGNQEIYSSPGSNTDVSYSDVEQTGYAGNNNNVDGNPNFNFLNGEYGGLQLQMPSIAIGTGDNAAIAGTEHDLAGNPRVAPTSGNVSMGAYQYQGPFVIYVDQTAYYGQDNGTSWANAFLTLSQALTYATAGFTVKVAEGDYGLNYPSGTFLVGDGVDLQGGYADRGSSAAYPNMFVTYLDGDHLGNEYLNGPHNDTVVTFDGDDSSTIIEGFTIENGDSESGSGGGLLDTASSPQIIDCVFTSNNSSYNGAAIENYDRSSPSLVDCIFTVNSASESGGAISNEDLSSPLIFGCMFYGNTCYLGGGAVSSDATSDPQIINCTFTKNSGELAGAIFVANATTVTNSILWNDTSTVFPIYDETNGGATVTESDIDGGYAAGLFVINANPLFANGNPAALGQLDLQEQNGSPCIGQGIAQVAIYNDAATGVNTDLAGNPRVNSVAEPHNRFTYTVDMGAYQFQGPISLIFSGEPPATVASGSPFSPYLNLYQNGHLVTFDTSTVTIAIASGPAGAILGGTLQEQVIGGHQAQFNNITITGPAGAYTLLATDGGDISATSVPFEVTAANIVSPTPGLGFVQEPTAVAAGATMTPAVQVGVYLAGVLDTINNSQITLSIGGINVASASVNNGVAYFGNLSFATPGTYALTASLSNSSATIQSSNFTVGAAAPVYTLFVGPQPSDAIAGNPFSISVTEKDQNGTQAYSDNTSQVSLSYSYTGSIGGTLAGTTPPVTVNQGVANFTLTPSASGDYLITASDGSDFTGSLGVNVVAPVTYLVFTQEPGNITIGGASAQFAVSVEQNGQVVTSDTSTIRVTVIQPNFAAYGGTLNVPVTAGTGTAYFNHYFLGNLAEGYNVILQATDLTNSNDLPTDSTSFQAFPAPPRYLSVRVSSTAAAGTSFYAGGFGMTDTYFDAIAPDASGVTVSIDSGPAGATLGGTLTEPMDVGFNNLVLTKAGAYGLEFTDAADGVTAYGGVTIISDGIPTQLGFVQQPATVATNAGIEAPVAVGLEDQYGNVVTTDNSDVVNLYLASSTSPGAALGGPISVTAVDGVATFTGASVNAVGTYTLGASSDSYSAVTSNSFNVTSRATVYVDASASGADTGNDWPDAFTNLQSALAVAIPGDTIDVAQGDYSPGNVAADTFQLLDGVTVQGGFGTAGFGGPNATAYPTILDGMNTNYHVVTADGTDASALLEGFTIAGGNANSGGGYTDGSSGGGLIADGGAPTISNCIFTSNTAYYGGAMFIANQVSASATVTNCIFQNNTAISGGGALYDVESSPFILNSQFLNNSTTDFGDGGALLNQGSDPTLVNCLFVGNVASQPSGQPFGSETGGAIYDDGSSPNVTNCTISGNSAIFGAGIANDAASSPILTNDILWNNNAEYGGNEIYGGTPTVTNSIVGGGYTGAGNLNTDPLFADPTDGNYQLQPTSPSINAGSNAAPGLAGIATDLAGNPRFVDGVVDIGPYESQVVEVSWTGAADGTTWNNPGNWSDDVVPTQNDNVFIPAGAGTILVPAGAYAVGTLDSSMPVEIASGGTLTLYGASTFSDGLTIDSGGSVVNATTSFSSNQGPLVVNGLSIVSGGTLDIGSGAMVVQGGDLALVTQEIASGYNGGAWTGRGITSSAAEADSSHLTALGVILNDDGSGNPLYGSGTALGLFDGYGPADGDVLVKYTYYGDANLDGKVSASDYSLIDNGYLNHLSGWYNGGFNYDGVVNGSDYTLIDNAFNMQGASLSAEIAASSSQTAAVEAIVSGVPSASDAKASDGRREDVLHDRAFVPANVFQTATPITVADPADGSIEMLLHTKDLLDQLGESLVA